MRLDFLELGFRDAYCSCGRCSLLHKAFETMTLFAWSHPPKTIQVRGVPGPEDMQLLLDRLNRGVAWDGTEVCFKQKDTVIHRVRVVSRTRVTTLESRIRAARFHHGAVRRRWRVSQRACGEEVITCRPESCTQR